MFDKFYEVRALRERWSALVNPTLFKERTTPAVRCLEFQYNIKENSSDFQRLSLPLLARLLRELPKNIKLTHSEEPLEDWYNFGNGLNFLPKVRPNIDLEAAKIKEMSCNFNKELLELPETNFELLVHKLVVENGEFKLNYKLKEI